MTVYFHEVGSQERRRQLSRYVVAYDGDTTAAVDERTTHILCGEEATTVCDALT